MDVRNCSVCDAEFMPKAPQQHRCDLHKENHKKRTDGIDLRYGDSSKRTYKLRNCDECGVEYQPVGAGSRYCEEHSGSGQWERRNRERSRQSHRVNQRRYRHKRDFGDPYAYEHAVERYGEQCAICGAKPENGMHLAIDHSHATGDIRGLLCGVHNTGLGYFQDAPDLLRRAAAYLSGEAVTAG